MERRPVDKEKIEETIEFIYRNAMGNITKLTASPTSQDHMKANTMGYYNDELFIRLDNGDIKKITLTSVV